MKEKQKAEHIVDILHGNKTSEVMSYHHDELENFGAASDEDESTLHAIIRQALLVGMLKKDVDSYGDLKLQSDGKKFIRKAGKFEVPIEVHNEDEDGIEGGGIACAAADEVLFSILKDIRRKLSKKCDVPPFVIFQDPSLEDMTIQYPITMDELTQIVGVGQGKAQKFGQPFLDLIKEYVEENEITRPNDMVIKSSVNRSALKISIIQNIDRKIPLEDIAPVSYTHLTLPTILLV